MEQLPVLRPRLAALASAVKEGAIVADIGTDHALLPIYLVGSGHAARAIASDIHAGPAERARAAVEANALTDSIEVVCTDGLHGIEQFAPDHIVIAGMGGEMIVRILDEAPFVKERRCRLLLQPMTHAPTLRAYLSGNGFAIEEEALPVEDRIYEVIVASYTGTSYALSPLELTLGPCNLRRGGQVLAAHAARRAEVLEGQIAGRMRANLDCRAEIALAAALRETASCAANKSDVCPG